MPRRPLSTDEISATRNELLDAAQELFERGGLEAMSFRAIADAAGCSHTKPYSYFDSKGQIVDHLRRRAYEWLRDVITVAASAHPEPIDALRALAEAYVRAGIDRPRLYELMYSEHGTEAETEPALMAAKLDAIGVCQRVIESASERGDVTFTTDPQTTAHLFWVAAHGLVSLHNGGFLVVGRTVDDLMPALFATAIAGATTPEELS